MSSGNSVTKIDDATLILTYSCGLITDSLLNLAAPSSCGVQ